MFKSTLKVAVLGATGMVGQQFIRMLDKHPWFSVEVVAASAASAGKPYKTAVDGRWVMETSIPARIADYIVADAHDVGTIAAQVDIAFCAVDLDKEKVKVLENAYAEAGVWVTSNNSAFRLDPFTPMIIPAVNPEHLAVITQQRKARNYPTGGIIVKSNCSLQSYVIALTPLLEFGLQKIRVHSDQAISGAGKTFATWPEMDNNLIPFIKGEEQKSEIEPLKIWGKVSDTGIIPCQSVKIKARCSRVAVANGHTAFVTAHFKELPGITEILQRWDALNLSAGTPTAPKKIIIYRPEPDRPQPGLDVMNEKGMGVTIGQLKIDESDNTIEFTSLAHNAILGAAGGAIWATEVALKKGYIFQRVNGVQQLAVAD